MPPARGIRDFSHSPPPTIGATVAVQSRLDKVIALARHRGFVFQAGEIYGGSRSARGRALLKN